MGRKYKVGAEEIDEDKVLEVIGDLIGVTKKHNNSLEVLIALKFSIDIVDRTMKGVFSSLGVDSEFLTKQIDDTVQTIRKNMMEGISNATKSL